MDTIDEFDDSSKTDDFSKKETLELPLQETEMQYSLLVFALLLVKCQEVNWTVWVHLNTQTIANDFARNNERKNCISS